MKKFLTMGSLSYLLIGLAHVVAGSVMPELLRHYGLPYEAGGALIFSQFAGFLLGVLVTPAVLTVAGPRKTLVLAAGLLTAAEITYTLLPPWGVMLAAAPVAGVGFGTIEAVIGALVISSTGEKRAVYMSRLEVFFGIGALVIPILAGICIWLGSWNTSFLTVGGLSLLLAILWARLSFGELDAALARKPKTVPEPGQETGYRGKALVYFSLFVAFFFLYVGLEMSLVNFFPSILLEKFSMESAGASVSVTLFWLAMAVGRIFAGTLSMRVGYGKYLVWGCAGTLLCLAGLRLAPYYGLTFGFLMLAGLAMAGLFSIALVYASHLLPGREERTTSLLIGAGGLGGAVLPLLTGWSMDHWKVFGTQSLLAAVSLLLILMVGAALVMERAGRAGRTVRTERTG